MTKNFVRIVALFCVLAVLFTTTACRKTPTEDSSYSVEYITEYIEDDGDDDSSADKTESNNSTNNSSSNPTNSSKTPNNPSNTPSGNTSSNKTNSTPTSSSSNPTVNLKNPQKYSYSPIITDVMPVVKINTADGKNTFATKYDQEDKLNDLIDYVDATVSTDNCTASEKLTDVEAEVKVRGNYTLNYEKKALRIKFKKKQNMLSLGGGEKYKNWVLLADWKDVSMTNNALAFYLGNMILGSDGYYCTDFRNVEVYLNGQYWGVYLLVEQQEVKGGRVNIPEVEDDYTGTDIAYFFEYDGYYDQEINMPNNAGDPTFTVDYHDYSYQPGFTVKSDIYSNSQLSFLKNKVQSIFDTAHSAINTSETVAKKTIGDIIDLQSLVDMYILSEICCDPDLNWSSFYMSLDMTANGNKKLVFQAPWDYDSSFGIRTNFSSPYAANYSFNSKNPWFGILKYEKWFTDMVKEKWAELKANGITDGALDMISKMETTYAPYYERNFERWPKRIADGNDELTDEVNSLKSQAEASRYLYKWLTTRFNYLDNRWS